MNVWHYAGQAARLIDSGANNKILVVNKGNKGSWRIKCNERIFKSTGLIKRISKRQITTVSQGSCLINAYVNVISSTTYESMWYNTE